MKLNHELDARKDYNNDPAYVADLIKRAADKLGSRNIVARQCGICRRRLGYLEQGERRYPNGTTRPVVIGFDEQVTLEAAARE